MTSKFGAVTVVGLMIACSAIAHGQVGRTEITKWQYGKSGAVSLTYDDGTINQFRVAVPIMDTFGFPATFFIITGTFPVRSTTARLLAAQQRRSSRKRRAFLPIETIFLSVLQPSHFWAIKERSTIRLGPGKFMTKERMSSRHINSWTSATRRCDGAPFREVRNMKLPPPA
jgi:hypothetical protein